MLDLIFDISAFLLFSWCLGVLVVNLRGRCLSVFLLSTGLMSSLPAATISGFVRELGTGEPIASVIIEIEGTETGTLSENNGYYVLSEVPAGYYVLDFTIIGYRPHTETLVVTPDQSVRRDVRLKPEPVAVKPVTVTAERARFRQDVEVGVQRLRPMDFKLSPGLFEHDLFKSLQILPGVLSISDFSSALYVRGGSPDQNLVLLDGVEIYSPYHLGGLFSTFSLDALSNAELHSGAFPAQYGNAVSSVLDVEMKQGNSERYSGNWDLGLLSTRGTLEGPIPHGSFLISGRRTYIDLLTGAARSLTGIQEIYLPYHFYDLLAKVNVDVSAKHRLTASGFFGDDVLYLGDSFLKLDFRWGNLALNLKWRWLMSPSLFSVVQFTRGRYRVALNEEYYSHDSTGRASDTTQNWMGLGIGNYGLRQDVNWYQSANHSLRLGWEAKPLDVFDRLSADTTVYLDIHDRPTYLALYAADKWHAATPLWLDLGVRGEYFSGGRFLRVAPRVGAKYLLPGDLALKAGYGHYYQYLSIPFPRDEMMMKMPVFMFQQWLPASSQYPPVQAVHYTLGAEKWISNELNVGLEGYFKTMSNLLETDMPFAFPFSPESVSFGKGAGWATGAEVLVKWKNNWIGYSLGWTRRDFDDVEFYPIFDTRHSVNVAWGIPLGKGWNLSLQWLFHTGFPYTGSVGRYESVDPDYSDYYYWQYIDGRRGDLRYPPYHRLDASIEKSFRLFAVNWNVYLQVVNVYARKNVLYYDYMDDEYGRPQRQAITFLPFPIPSLGLRGSF
jgi:hypothetical protein